MFTEQLTLPKTISTFVKSNNPNLNMKNNQAINDWIDSLSPEQLKQMMNNMSYWLTANLNDHQRELGLINELKLLVDPEHKLNLVTQQFLNSERLNARPLIMLSAPL